MTQYNFTVDYGLTIQNGNLTATTPNNTAAINFAGNSSGDGGGYTTIQLVPDETVFSGDQYVIIDPTVGPVAGHIHIRAGGPQDNSLADLFLGGENSYVKLPAGLNPNVEIAANSQVWTFNTNGTLKLPGGNTNAQAILGSESTYGITLGFDQGDLDAGKYLKVRGGGDDYSHIHLDTGNSAAYNLFLGDDSKYVLLANTGNVVIRSDNNAGNASWTFAPNGTEWLPGGTGSISSSANNILIWSDAAQTNGVSMYDGGIDIFGTNDVAIYADSGNLTWTFDNTGTLLAPGAISAVGNITGNCFIGNGSQLTGLPAGYANSDVATFLAAFGSNSISTTGNVTANNISGNIQITGNVTGTSANVSLVAGSYTWTFDNTGNLQGNVTFTGANILINNAAGAGGADEGGQLNLATATANSTLSGPIAIDVYQNTMRFFETTGNTRGAYLDLSQASTSAGTLLNNRVSSFVNAGTYVTMDNLKATVSTGGNRSLEIATVTGSFSGYVNGTYTIYSGGTAGIGATITVTTTPALAINWNFTSAGDTVTYIITDTTNSRCYRITMMIGPSYNNNMISIERLV